MSQKESYSALMTRTPHPYFSLIVSIALVAPASTLSQDWHRPARLQTPPKSPALRAVKKTIAHAPSPTSAKPVTGMATAIIATPAKKRAAM